MAFRLTRGKLMRQVKAEGGELAERRWGGGGKTVLVNHAFLMSSRPQIPSFRTPARRQIVVFLLPPPAGLLPPPCQSAEFSSRLQPDASPGGAEEASAHNESQRVAENETDIASAALSSVFLRSAFGSDGATFPPRSRFLSPHCSWKTRHKFRLLAPAVSKPV